MSSRLADALSAEEERVAAIMAGLKRWTPEERERYMDDLGSAHPLLARPNGGGGGSLVEAAVRNAAYDELDSPYALACECREKGNAAFRAGAAFFANATRHYLDALRHVDAATAAAAGDVCKEKGEEEEEAEAPEVPLPPQPLVPIVPPPTPRALRLLTSACHANLAAIHLARGKFVSTIDAAGAALRADPDNVKAAWRATKACIATGRAASALEFAELGRAAAGDDIVAEASFTPLVAEASAMLSRQERAANEAARLRAASRDQRAAVRRACSERGIAVGRPLFKNMRRTSARPYEDEDGVLHWPVVVLYPAVGESDFVEDWAEVDTIRELLMTLLPHSTGGGGGGERPPWDARGEYAVTTVDVFFKTFPCAARPIECAWASDDEGEGGGDEGDPADEWRPHRWVLIHPDAPLMLPLVQPAHVVPDVPVLYVVPRDTPWWRDMRAAAGGAFARLEWKEPPPM